MTVSNIQRISESFEVEGGGTVATIGSIDASVEVSHVEEGGGGVTPEDSTLGCLELALIYTTLCQRTVAPIGAMIWTGLDVGNCFNPKCERI